MPLDKLFSIGHHYLDSLTKTIQVKKLNLLQGTLDLIVLKVLASGAQHGYAISQRIQEVSSDLLKVEEGSLYPALYRMEKKGWIQSRWGVTDKQRRARLYTLTHDGQRHLAEEAQQWTALTGVMDRIMELG